MTGWIRRVRLDRRSQQAFNIILAPRLSVEVRQIDISGCEMRCHIDHRLQCGFGFAELTQLSQSGPGVKQSLLSIGIELLRDPVLSQRIIEVVSPPFAKLRAGGK